MPPLPPLLLSLFTVFTPCLFGVPMSLSRRLPWACLLAGALLSPPASACECTEVADFETTAASSPHVVLVKAQPLQGDRVPLVVLRVLKGPPVGDAFAIAGGNGKSCNEPAGRFEAGQTYVLALPDPFVDLPIGTCKSRVVNAGGSSVQLNSGEVKSLDALQKSLNGG